MANNKEQKKVLFPYKSNTYLPKERNAIGLSSLLPIVLWQVELINQLWQIDLINQLWQVDLNELRPPIDNFKYYILPVLIFSDIDLILYVINESRRIINAYFPLSTRVKSQLTDIRYNLTGCNLAV